MTPRTQNIITGFILVVASVLLLAGFSRAAPWIVCDPQAGVTFYKATGPSWVPTQNITAQADGSLRMDVATAIVGNSEMTFRACNMWGTIENCSTPAPFTLSRPSSPLAPGTIRLVP